MEEVFRLLNFLNIEEGELRSYTSDDRLIVEINFETVELTEGEFDDLGQFLTSLGYLPTDDHYVTTNNYHDYTTKVGQEEYENFATGDRLILYVTKVYSKGETNYYLKKIKTEIQLERDEDDLGGGNNDNS